MSNRGEIGKQVTVCEVTAAHRGPCGGRLRTAAGGAPAKLFQRCPTLCALWTGPPGSSVHGILQARILVMGGHCHALLQGTFLDSSWKDSLVKQVGKGSQPLSGAAAPMEQLGPHPGSACPTVGDSIQNILGSPTQSRHLAPSKEMV